MVLKIFFFLVLLISSISCAGITISSKVVENSDFDSHDELRQLDSAKCRAECYLKNAECCNVKPNECGTTCFEEARKCYDNCRATKFETVQTVNCRDVMINAYNICLSSGKDENQCRMSSEEAFNICSSRQEQ